MFTVTEAPPVDRVERAVALLDVEQPGWWRNVNTSEYDGFNINDPSCCVLKQVFGGYIAGMDALGIRLDEAMRYGFASLKSERQLVEAEWRRQVNERVAA